MSRYFWMFVAGLSLFGVVAVLLTIDGPGLTVDEPFNTGRGKKLFFALSRHADQFADRDTIDWLWRKGHEHPPLTPLVIGMAHGLYDSNPGDPEDQSPKLGRPASALAFGLILFLVTRLAWRFGGPAAGICAGLCTLTMPRLFGHAHLASLEMTTSAILLLGLMAAARSIDAWRRPAWTTRLLWLFVAGVCLGLALLTRLSTVLLPVAVGVTGLCYLRFRFLVPFVVYSLLGLATFVLLWPWMWPVDLPGYSAGWRGTVERLREFASTGVDRATVYVGYFGRQYPNEGSRVPWHYVWFYFLVTVPLATHLFAVCGLPRLVRSARDNPTAALVLVQIATILGFFTLPIDKYDGERLFLAAFPLWAVVAGVGASGIQDSVSRWLPYAVSSGLLVMASASGLVSIVRLHPYELSYYNSLVGGLPGANRLGLEATYWGDTISTDVLDAFATRAAKGECVALVPTLFIGHTAGLTSPAMRSKNLAVLPPELAAERDCRWAIVFNRGGYLGDPLPQRVFAEGKVVYEVSRDGVWLSRLYELPAGFRWVDAKLVGKGGS